MSLSLIVLAAVLCGAPEAERLVIVPVSIPEKSSPLNYNWSLTRDGSVVTGYGWANHYWSRVDGLVAIKDEADGRDVGFRGVSADGSTLVGWCTEPGAGSGTRHAMAARRTPFRFRGERSGSRFATSASADGSVVVTFAEKRAWKPDTGEAVVLRSTDQFLAADITPDARYVVGEDVTVKGHAARWEATSGVVLGLGEYTGELPRTRVLGSGVPSDVPPMRVVWARGVSADGGVVVGYLPYASAPAVRWTEKSGWESLGWLPSPPARAPFSRTSPIKVDQAGAFDVSDDGSRIVGRSQDRAFLWSEDRGMRDLNAILVDAGTDLRGWTLTAALGISGDGLTVAGVCEREEESGGTVRQAWVARLPDEAPGRGAGERPTTP